MTTVTTGKLTLIFSAGDMAIGGSLDTNRQATGQVTTLNNASATIEALGNLTLGAAQLNNTNEHFSTQIVPVGSTETKHWQTGDYNLLFTYDTTVSQSQTAVVSSDPAKILSGAAMTLTGSVLTNDKSQIIAGGDLNDSGTQLNNIDAKGVNIVHESGTRLGRRPIWAWQLF